jgi:hypothetical protein
VALADDLAVSIEHRHRVAQWVNRFMAEPTREHADRESHRPHDRHRFVDDILPSLSRWSDIRTEPSPFTLSP